MLRHKLIWYLPTKDIGLIDEDVRRQILMVGVRVQGWEGVLYLGYYEGEKTGSGLMIEGRQLS